MPRLQACWRHRVPSLASLGGPTPAPRWPRPGPRQSQRSYQATEPELRNDCDWSLVPSAGCKCRCKSTRCGQQRARPDASRTRFATAPVAAQATCHWPPGACRDGSSAPETGWSSDPSRANQAMKQATNQGANQVANPGSQEIPNQPKTAAHAASVSRRRCTR